MLDEKYGGQMLSAEQAKSKIMEGWAHLSLEALNELVVFVEFLHSREQAVPPSNKEVVKLEGIWKDVPFDMTDEDIRQLRHDFTQQLQGRLEKI